MGALGAALVGDQRRHDDDAGGEEREQGVRRVLPEIEPFGLAVVAQLPVDPVPPDEVVDAERDYRQQGRSPRAADL